MPIIKKGKLEFNYTECKYHKKFATESAYLDNMYLYDVPKEQNKLIAKLSESIRFKVKPNGIKPFEIFKSKDVNFFGDMAGQWLNKGRHGTDTWPTP